MDINKIYARSTDLNKHNLGGQQSGTQGTPIREKDKSKWAVFISIKVNLKMSKITHS